MTTVQNTYYNIVNDMEVIKQPKAVPLINKKPEVKEKSPLAVNYGALAQNTTLIATLAGAAAGLLFSIITRKNYVLNIAIGSAIGYAGNEFILKRKKTASVTKKIPQISKV